MRGGFVAPIIIAIGLVLAGVVFALVGAVLRVEDAFLRSVLSGRGGEGPLGLMLDDLGMHFDSSTPSRLETILATDPLDNSALLNRARDAMARIQAAHLSKYNAFDPALPPPTAPYVLVIDQTRGDASVTASGADRARFLEMLVFAQEEHPGCRVVIKTHPETAQGFREGHFTDADANDRITLLSDPVSPWALFEGAVGVYTVSSQMGFEAIFAGHKPRVFGQPFYAGWGLTEDEIPVQRRQRRLTRAQLFAAAMILYPTWYDPYRDRLGSFETAVTSLAAQARAWREDHAGWDAWGMRLWKRRPLQQFFGQPTPIRFRKGPPEAPAPPRRAMVWASKADTAPTGALQVEDGFLRSRGLGAELVPPLSLVCDNLGIYYDPTRPSRLERLISQSVSLSDTELRRARGLIDTLVDKGVTKYASGTPDVPLPDTKGRRIILVPVSWFLTIIIGFGDDFLSMNIGICRNMERIFSRMHRQSST